jgi:hypothetical protein
MSLVARGALDLFIYAQPQVTLMRAVYRRICPLSFEVIEQYAQGGNPDFGREFVHEFARSGDFIDSACWDIELPELVPSEGAKIRWVDFPGHRLLAEMKVQIGGQDIDKTNWWWMQMQADLQLPAEAQVEYYNMIGHEFAVQKFTGEQALPTRLQAWTTDIKPARTIYVPIKFWFCENLGLALPLIALQYHQVRLVTRFAQRSEMIITDGTIPDVHLDSVTLLAGYVFVDTMERRRVAQVGHEYLIQCSQFNGGEETTTADHKISLQQINFSVSYFMLAYVHTSFIEAPSESNNYVGNHWYNWTDSACLPEEFSYAPVGARGPLRSLKLVLNGVDAQQERLGTYYNQVEPQKKAGRGFLSPGLYLFSFAAYANQYQPSSTLNFSRIDASSVQGHLEYSDTVESNNALILFGTRHYNLLRGMSGMAGLGFSN